MMAILGWLFLWLLSGASLVYIIDTISGSRTASKKVYISGSLSGPLILLMAIVAGIHVYIETKRSK